MALAVGTVSSGGAKESAESNSERASITAVSTAVGTIAALLAVVALIAVVLRFTRSSRRNDNGVDIEVIMRHPDDAELVLSDCVPPLEWDSAMEFAMAVRESDRTREPTLERIDMPLTWDDDFDFVAPSLPQHAVGGVVDAHRNEAPSDTVVMLDWSVGADTLMHHTVV